MISAKVTLTGQGWGREYAQRVERAVPPELLAASKEGAGVASSIASTRKRTGKMAEMELLEVERTHRGFSGGFRSKAWYANFQNKGTRTGIQPLGFLERGRAAARKSLVSRLNRIF